MPLYQQVCGGRPTARRAMDGGVQKPRQCAQRHRGAAARGCCGHHQGGAAGGCGLAGHRALNTLDVVVHSLYLTYIIIHRQHHQSTKDTYNGAHKLSSRHRPKSPPKSPPLPFFWGCAAARAQMPRSITTAATLSAVYRLSENSVSLSAIAWGEVPLSSSRLVSATASSSLNTSLLV